jgi:hypothetical protein
VWLCVSPGLRFAAETVRYELSVEAR